ncbi:MAG: ArsC/Spx/MgsR family protein [Tissierellia bacterium]|nr:ArsC/Spx/MgsR family protein [Tissierellia bacterium]
MLFICYSKCSTCKKIQKIMDEKKMKYEFRDIKENPPTAKELKKWHEKSGLDLVKFYNTSGIIYREQNIKEKRANMNLEEQYQLLATDGMLVKRPILIDGDDIYVGPLVKKFVEGK